MSEHFLNGAPGVGIFCQTLLDQVFTRATHMCEGFLVEGDLALLDLFDQLWQRFSIEWLLSTNQKVEDGAESPHIDLAILVLTGDHLWGHVGWCAVCFLFYAAFMHAGEAKVHDFYLA